MGARDHRIDHESLILSYECLRLRVNFDLPSHELQVLILDILSHLRTWIFIYPVTFNDCELDLQNLRTCGIIFQLQKPRSLEQSMPSVSRDLVLMDPSMDKNYEVTSNTTRRRCSYTSNTNCQLITQVSTKDEPPTPSLDSEYDFNCNKNNAYDTNKNTMFEGSFDDGSGEQVVLNHGERINHEHSNDTSSTNHTHNSTIHSIIDIVNSKITFDGTYSRREWEALIDTDTGNVGPESNASRISSSVDIYNTYLHEDKTIGIISVQDNVHQFTNASNHYTGNVVNTNNDNDSTSIANSANANYYDTRSGLSLPSEYGERIMISNDSEYTSISITIILDSNNQHWRIDCICSPRTHNERASYNDMCTLSNIVNNSIYHLLIKYDWIRDEVVRFVGRTSILTSLCSVGTLHNSKMIYDMDASMHTDEDIEDRMCQDGERRMSMHINVNESEVADCMAATHNILSLDNVNMKDNMQASYDQLGYILGNTMTTNNVLRFGNYKVCKYIKRDDNTCKCGTNQTMFECKGIGIGNGIYKCRTANTKYNTMAIRTSSWIVLTIGYMHTTLHQLESSEHKTVCSRLDGRGVSAERFKRYASNLVGLKRYLALVGIKGTTSRIAPTI